MHRLLLSSLKTEKKEEFTLSIFSVHRPKTNQSSFTSGHWQGNKREVYHLHIFLWVHLKCTSFKGGLFRSPPTMNIFVYGHELSKNSWFLWTKWKPQWGGEQKTTKPQGCYNSHELVLLQKNNHQPLNSSSKMSSESSTQHMLSWSYENVNK